MTGAARASILASVACAAALGLLSAAGCASPQKDIEEVRSDDQEDRIDAALSLAEGVTDGDPDYVAARPEIATRLRGLLDDKSALVRQVAIETLAAVEGKAAVGPIADRLRDRDPWVRYTAVRKLGQLDARAATEGLAEVLRKDESPDVRRAAAQALAKLQAKPALRDLYLALQDLPAVRYHAYLALRAITGQDHGEDPRAWRAVLPRGAGE